MEKEIKMAAKLYEYRDAAKRFCALVNEEYKEKLKPYDSILRSVMKANQVEAIPALLLISKTNSYNDNAVAQLLFTAALVEIIEPSKN